MGTTELMVHVTDLEDVENSPPEIIQKTSIIFFNFLMIFVYEITSITYPFIIRYLVLCFPRAVSDLFSSFSISFFQIFLIKNYPLMSVATQLFSSVCIRVHNIKSRQISIYCQFSLDFNISKQRSLQCKIHQISLDASFLRKKGHSDHESIYGVICKLTVQRF